MKTVHLHGRLGKEFGRKHRFDIATAGEAFRALNCAFPGRFVEVLREGSYRIVRGDAKTGINLDLNLVCKLNLGQVHDLHIIPVASGSSSKGTGTLKAVAGIAIVGAAIFFSGGTLASPLAASVPGLGSLGMTYGNIALFGLGVSLMGVSQMLAKTDSSADQESSETNWAFNGPVNVSGQGAVVPLVYGRAIVAGRTVSAGMTTENTTVYGDNE